MSFEALLGKIHEASTLAKALPADGQGDGNKKSQTAAAGAGENSGTEGGQGNDPNADSNEGQEDENGVNPLTKSFLLKLDDGTDVEAFDGTELVKSLTLRVQTAETALKQNEAHVLKSLNAAVDLLSTQSAQLKEQGNLIKSLQGRVAELAKTGRGRTSILTVTEKPQLETVNKSQTAVMGGEELIAKALGAMKSGRISGLEASGIENRVRMGIAVDPALIARVCS